MPTFYLPRDGLKRGLWSGYKGRDSPCESRSRVALILSIDISTDGMRTLSTNISFTTDEVTVSIIIASYIRTLAEGQILTL